MMRQMTGHPNRQFAHHACPTILTIALALVLTALAIVSGCAGGTDIGNPEGASFSSDGVLKSYIADQYAQSALPDSMKDDVIDGVPQPEAPDTPGSAAFKDYSETSIRETGVDESDKVKTGGNRIYVAGTSTVHIVDTTAEDGLNEAARIPVKGPVDSLYLYGASLVILYTPEDGSGELWSGRTDEKAPAGIGIPEWIPVGSRIGILTVDIQDPENPAIQTDLQVEGRLVSSRLTNGLLHVVTQFLPDLPPLELSYDGSETGKGQTIDANRELLDAMTLDDLVPSYESYDTDGVMTRQGRLVETENFIKPETPGGGSVVAVITLDLADLSKTFTSVGLISDVHHVYASKDSLFLSATRYDGAPVENGSPDASRFQTELHQLDISSAEVRHAASGTVPGQILDLLSMSEYADVLRIATTTGHVWDGSAQNHVYCLQRQDKTLTMVGKLENLASGKRGTAARFIKARGFLATSAESGRLLTLDLSKTESPSVAGELKTPGIGAALYPLGDQFLLTMGKAATTADDESWYQGIQLALFDTSDFAAAKLLSTHTIGDRGTESEALYNHKALTFRPEESLLALPMALYEHQNPQPDPSETGAPVFNGLYVYELTGENIFKYRGRISMADEGSGMFNDAGWLRGVFMNNRVYAVSADKVVAGDLPDISEPFESVILGE
ncbi:MAG: hypothetical protein C4518_19820 [Desulfobacteraceae bacterium]|nr:MAG: hypothetical protein C4518_19820 [Desulfobacteraceae bacterium]